MRGMIDEREMSWVMEGHKGMNTTSEGPGRGGGKGWMYAFIFAFEGGRRRLNWGPDFSSWPDTSP